MIYADFDFYVGQYHGSMPSEAFLRMSHQASAYLDQITFDRIQARWEDGPYAEKIRMACCAVADVIYQQEQGGEVVSQTVGPWTKQFAGSGKTVAQKQYAAAGLYLGRTELMQRWC